MTRHTRWDATLLAEPATSAHDVHQVLREFNNTVMSMTVLDPVTTEIIRLRCARSHDCRLCKATRSVASINAGMDDDLTDKIDLYESSDLPERYKVALRVTDAIITWPGSLDAALAAQAHEHFSEAELAELCLYVVKFSTQKIGVSLGTDGTEAVPTNADGTTFVEYNADGSLKGFSDQPIPATAP